MLRHCIALRNLTPCFLPSASSAAKSRAVLSSSLNCLSSVAEPSLTISRRQVSGVRRALTRASPLRECGFGSPRLTSRNASGLVRKGGIGESRDEFTFHAHSEEPLPRPL